MLSPHPESDDLKRMIITVVLLGLGMFLYQYFYELPKQQADYQQRQEQTLKRQQEAKVAPQLKAEQNEAAVVEETDAPSIRVKSDEVEGAISLRGARLSALTLLNYRQEVDADSPPVELLHPAGRKDAYFIDFGWLADGETPVPTAETVWQAGGEELGPEKPVTLFWDNGQGQRFEIVYRLKGPYLFDVQQRVINSGTGEVTVHPYGYINRTYDVESTHYLILHEGPLGVLDGSLKEIEYKEMLEEKQVKQENATGWLGITDKYWLTALIPQGGGTFTGNFKGYEAGNGTHKYQADYLRAAQKIAPGATSQNDTLLFAGAKKLDLLDRYSEEYKVPLFDRAVDFGVLYFLTNFLYKVLSGIYGFVGNFGIAILILTILVKALMYPLANKSYHSMNEMKELQPKINKLKERCGEDVMKFRTEMMEIYKKEKINPAAGCLPTLIQIPVFFALYKVLFVTIDMRHAPFYGFVRDLSAPDPTNIFTAFGLIDWTPPHLLHLGILPILMAATIAIQQKLNPKPTDPTQAKVMAILPWIFMVAMAKFPAGLLIYWIWSNIISIAQQWSIKSRYSKNKARRAAAS